MTFIGFISDKKEENILKKTLELKLREKGIKAVVIAINEKNIENIKSIRFETIIMNTDITMQFFDKLKEMLKVTKYLIINGDIVHFEKIQNMNLTIITYGFGNKCTVTTSSVEEDEMIICLQRSIYNIKGEKIESQEIREISDLRESTQYIIMVISTINFIYS